MRTYPAITTLLATCLFASNTWADVAVVEVNEQWDDGGYTAFGIFNLPDIEEVLSVSVEISHTNAGDITLAIDHPGGSWIVQPYNDGFGGPIGVTGTGQLDDLATYTAVESYEGAGAWDTLGGGTFEAYEWESNISAGAWAFGVWDVVDGPDGGAVGSITIEYISSIPEPTSSLLCTATVFALLLRQKRKQR